MKEKFEQYELILTPAILILVLFFLYYPGGIINVMLEEDFLNLFVIPSIIGNIAGLFMTILLDYYWRQISKDNMMNFLRIPSLFLMLLALLASSIISINLEVSFIIFGLGLGSMITLIATSSLIAYYRAFYKMKPLNKDLKS